MGEGWLVVKNTAPLLVLAAGILWGLMGIFVRTLASFGFSSLEIAGLRIFFGAMLFAAITAAARPEQLKIRLRDAGLFVGMGLLSLLLFTMCYFSVIRMASLSVAAILLYTSPIWVMLMSLACFHEPLSLPVLAIGLLSAVGYGMYSIFGTFALRKYPPLTVTTWAFLFGAAGSLLVCSPVHALQVVRTAEHPVGLLVLLVVTAFATAVLPYLLYTVGLSRMRASTAAIMASIEPVVAIIAGAAVFGETLTLPALAGIFLVLGAIVVLNRGQTA